MNVKNVRSFFVVIRNLFHIRVFILERNPTIVRNVGKHLDCSHNLLNIRVFILVRNPMTVRNVERPLDLSLIHISEPTRPKR